MDVESATQEIKKGALANGCAKLKEFAEKMKSLILEVAFMTKKLGEDDPRRIKHSLKVGLALTLVSLLYYVRPLYDSFGVSGMWAVLTVVVVFEFTVGGTLSKGLNRGFGTILAGGLGIGAQSLASLFGDKGEPIVLGSLVFILAAAATFSRFVPRIKARYDYGVLIFILTFSLVTISGYRVDKVLEMAQQRLYTILIGGATCIFISIFVCPVWAGETLHNSIASNIEKVANYLEGFGGEYFQQLEEDGVAVVGVSKKDRSFLCGYQSVLHSQSSEETLANFARWEPGHGRFLFRHPWQQYLKVGRLTRSCAFKIEAIRSCIDSDHKVVLEFQKRIEEPCKKMSSESSKALKILASGIKTKTRQSSAKSHVEKAKAAINHLKIELQAASVDVDDLAAIAQAATVASTLVEIVKSVEELSKSVEELSRLARFEKSPPQEKSQIHHRSTITPVLDTETDDEYIVITVNDHAIKTNSSNAGMRG